MNIRKVKKLIKTGRILPERVARTIPPQLDKFKDQVMKRLGLWRESMIWDKGEKVVVDNLIIYLLSEKVDFNSEDKIIIHYEDKWDLVFNEERGRGSSIFITKPYPRELTKSEKLIYK